ncbi:MAG: bifunctional 4-hydroxy-2-oxoglutarate aldolase/2-dehydro-3-deoxy-phosphogluconate aldolase, partial [Desulfobacterales bacterium]
VGAGTVLTIDQAQQATRAGAQFIVAPGFNPKVVDYCLGNDILMIPGINNPSQIESALERELAVVKFFPAEASGGLPLLKAMAEPYSGIQFLPTGGINPDNLTAYLSFARVIACGGSWMVKAELIDAGRFDEIVRLAREAVRVIEGLGAAPRRL